MGGGGGGPPPILAKWSTKAILGRTLRLLGLQGFRGIGPYFRGGVSRQGVGGGGRGVPPRRSPKVPPTPHFGRTLFGSILVWAPKGGMSMGGRRRPPMIPPTPLVGGSAGCRWWGGLGWGEVRMAFTAMRRQLFPEGKFSFEEAKLKKQRKNQKKTKS